MVAEVGGEGGGVKCGKVRASSFESGKYNAPQGGHGKHHHSASLQAGKSRS